MIDACQTRLNSGFSAKLTPSPVLYSQIDARSDHLPKSPQTLDAPRTAGRCDCGGTTLLTPPLYPAFFLQSQFGS